MIKLDLPPTKEGYSVTDADGTVYNKLPGGRPRLRLDVVGGTAELQVQWTVEPVEFEYLRAFYSAATARGSEPFLIDLLLDTAELTEHTASFVPGSMMWRPLGGGVFAVVAKLDVVPIANDEFQLAFVNIFNVFGKTLVDGLAAIDIAINDDLGSIAE